MKIQAARICIQFAARSTELATLALVALLSASAHAGDTWDGGGADNNWTTDSNWNANCPLCLDSMPDNDGTADIRMAGTTRLTPRVDVDWDIDSLTFNNTAGAFSISGNASVSLGIGTGGITNNDAQLQLLLLPIALNASQTWNAAAGPLSIGNTVAGHPLLTRTLTLDGANNIQIAGAITNGAALNKTGAGTLTFNGLNTNTYTGSTTVSAGTLALGRTGGPNRAIPRNLVIGDGAGTDTVRLDAAEQITEAAGRTVTVNGSGLLNLNGFNETLANLAINGGSLSGAGSLVVNEALTFTGGGAISTVMLSAPASPAVVNSGLLNISSAGRISNTAGRIGSIAGSNGAVSINGASSAWTNSQGLNIGGAGTGTLNVTSGGQVTSTVSYIGDQFGSVGEVTVEGMGSTWSTSGDLYVGNGGDGTLNLTLQARLNALNGFIGYSAASTGEVNIAAATWTIGESPGSPVLFVGYEGDGELNIRDGQVRIQPIFSSVGDSNVYIGYGGGSTGSITVEGGFLGTFSNDTLVFLNIGYSGNGSLNVIDGGKVDSDFNYIGYNAGAIGSVIVDGTQSVWTVGTVIFVGYQGQGTLEITDGGQVLNVEATIGAGSGSHGSVTVDGLGSSWFNSGTLEVGGSGHALLTVTNAGIVAASQITVGAFGAVQGDGTLVGDVVAGGLISPGTSPGPLNIDGDYTQTADGDLLIELASASSYDQLLVTGDVTLAGTFTVNLLDGFTPSIGQTFTILTTDDVDGEFDTEPFPTASHFGFDVIYNTQSVVLSVVSALPGDYNGDGTVDAGDYIVWRKYVGAATLNNRDPNAMGVVGQADYDFWQIHFGETVGSGAGAGANAVVPEPATLVLLMFAAAGWYFRRGRAAWKCPTSR